jgi:hypothetical protein
MNQKIKEAADRLLNKGSITQEEYQQLEKISEISIPGISPKEYVPGLHPTISNVAAKTGQIYNRIFGITPVGPFAKKMVDYAGRYAIPIGLIGAAAYAGKEAIVDPLMQLLKIYKAKKEMISKVPILEDQDPELVNDYFNVVKQYSPKAAANPLVAGALVNKMIQFGGVDHKLIQDLGSIEGEPVISGAINKAVEGATRGIYSEGFKSQEFHVNP